MNSSEQKNLENPVKKLLKPAYLFDPEDLGGDGVLEHAAYELLPLQLLILVLVAHVVHLRHHCSQVNLQNQGGNNQALKKIKLFIMKNNSFISEKYLRKKEGDY
jgi:hypothetical protein